MAASETILETLPQAKAKPCLRCGYSLRGITSVNCPECGLAARISLAQNNLLEWSHPSWQRLIALGFASVGLGLLCKIIDFILSQVMRWSVFGYYQISHGVFTVIDTISAALGVLSPILFGIGFLLQSRPERRYPDLTVGGRRVLLASGAALVAMGLVNATAIYDFLAYDYTWVFYVLWQFRTGPYVPFVVCILVCAGTQEIGKRGTSQPLVRISQFPIAPSAIGTLFWIINGHWLTRLAQSVALDLAFPATALAAVFLAVRVLLRGAREADANWVTDPEPLRHASSS